MADADHVWLAYAVWSAAGCPAGCAVAPICFVGVHIYM
jgi:hypothetical protein